MRHVRFALAVALAAPIAGLLLPTTTAEPAAAAGRGPVSIPLTDPANGGSCPQGNYVVVSPGGPTQVFVVVPPGPPGCAPGGLDMTINPGGVGNRGAVANPGAVGAPPGEAVALPLTADSCEAGTQLIDSQISALGQTSVGGIGSGPPAGGGSPCPGGDAALAQLQAVSFKFASRLLEEEGIYYFFKHTENGHKLVAVGGGARGVPVLGGVFDASTTNRTGVFGVRPPRLSPSRFALEPSGITGVSSVVCVVCVG